MRQFKLSYRGFTIYWFGSHLAKWLYTGPAGSHYHCRGLAGSLAFVTQSIDHEYRRRAP